MTDIQARLADINRRAAAATEERARLQAALGKAITLILTVAAAGVLTVLAIAPTEQNLKASARINQEQITWQK